MVSVSLSMLLSWVVVVPLLLDGLLGWSTGVGAGCWSVVWV